MTKLANKTNVLIAVLILLGSGFIYSQGVQVLPPEEFSRRYQEHGFSYKQEELDKYLKAISQKDITSISSLIEKGFDFGIPAKLGDYNGRLYLVGLQVSDSIFLSKYVDLVFTKIEKLEGYFYTSFFTDGNPFEYAIYIGNKLAIDAILTRKPELLTQEFRNEVGGSPLLLPGIVNAIKTNNIDLVAYLLDKGFNPKWIYKGIGVSSINTDGYYANLVYWSTSKEMTDYLIKRGVQLVITFPEPWDIAIPKDTKVFLTEKMESTEVTKIDLKAKIIAITAIPKLVDDDHRHDERLFIVDINGKSYFVYTYDIETSYIWDI